MRPPRKGQQVNDDLWVIAVDFDGTLCEKAYPDIGAPIYTMIEVAIYRKKVQGCKLILWTCRTDQFLADAVAWCATHGLHFDAVNDNIPERVALFGSNPRKVNADEYWDDKSVPLEIVKRIFEYERQGNSQKV